jgi:Xaa-Pro aminopeptidase
VKYFNCLILCLSVALAVPSAQPVFRGSEIFPAEEFAARRAKVFDQIGDAVAIVLGTTQPPGEMPFRQNNQFFYLAGSAEPRSYLILDGRTRKTMLFLPPKNERQERSMYGPALSPGPEAAQQTGVDEAPAAEQFTPAVKAYIAGGRTIFTPFGAEVLGSQSSGDPTRLWAANKRDEWDGRDSREQAFIAKLKEQAPNLTVRDLDPVINGLRAVKSAREIQVIREATRLAGLGVLEAMRDARPGMTEYELQADAEFVFKKGGAFGASYFALIATGEDTYYSHYNRNTATLKGGDLVQFDYAPDYKYYQSDVTRIFPANGTFTSRQREMYTIYLKLYQALMTSIKAHARLEDVKTEAGKKMDAIIAGFAFTDEKIKQAAINMAAPYKTPPC